MNIAYGAPPKRLRPICQNINQGLREKKDLYGDGRELSKGQFFKCLRLAKDLGFVKETDGKSLRLTKLGEKLVRDGETPEIFRRGIQNYDLYREMVQDLEPRGEVEKEVTKDEVMQLMDEKVPRASSTAKEAGPTTFFRVLEKAGYGDYVKRGTTKVFVFNKGVSEDSKDLFDYAKGAPEEEKSSEPQNGSEAYPHEWQDSNIVIDPEKLSKNQLIELLNFLNGGGK